MDTVRHDEPTLPAAPWRDQPGLKRLADALGARDGDARYVGGAVRDTLLGLDVADIDIATRHAPAEVIARLEGGGIRAVPTGIDHGTVTAVSSGTVVEVTTLRRDVSTDGRRATVALADEERKLDSARYELYRYQVAKRFIDMLLPEGRFQTLALMLLVAKLGGELFAKLGQPAVLGELVGGVLLGSLSLFGVA